MTIMSGRVRTRTPVALVMASSDPALDEIRRQLEQLDIVPQEADSLREFQRLIQHEQPVEVVISGISLPDGNWCDVLRSTVRTGSGARVLVCSREADEHFWSEAIWRGVYDVLVSPFTAEYLGRSLEFRGPGEQGGQARGQDPNRQHGSAEEAGTEATLVAMAAVA